MRALFGVFLFSFLYGPLGPLLTPLALLPVFGTPLAFPPVFGTTFCFTEAFLLTMLTKLVASAGSMLPLLGLHLLPLVIMAATEERTLLPGKKMQRRREA